MKLRDSDPIGKRVLSSGRPALRAGTPLKPAIDYTLKPAIGDSTSKTQQDFKIPQSEFVKLRDSDAVGKRILSFGKPSLRAIDYPYLSGSSR